MEDNVHPEAAARTEIADTKRDAAAHDNDFGHVEKVMSADESDMKDHVNHNLVDQEVSKYTDGEVIHVSEEDSKRLRKLIDRRVLVVMIITYFIQALDKGTMSFTSIMGIYELPGIEANFPFLTSCIYFAILVVEYPQNWIIQRIPIAKYLGVNIILWSIVLCCHAACVDFSTFLGVRTLLGIFESVCQPAFLWMSGMWYKRAEQAETVTYWYMMNGFQQIVGGLLAYCFSLIDNESTPPPALLSWQALFICYGGFSFLWGIFVLWWLPDSPMRAKCYSEDDKKKMVERVRSNQTGIQNKVFRKEQVYDALTDVQTWCYCLIQICTTLPTSGLGAFANLIITSFEFSVLETQLLAMVLGAYIIVVLLSSMWLSNYFKNNCLVIAAYVVPAIVGTVVLMTVENTGTATQAGLLFSYYICLSFWAAQTLGMSLLTRNVAGQTKKSVVTAMNFIAWAAGNAVGPQVFLEYDSPRYFIAFSTHMGCYALLLITIFTLYWHLRRQNSLRDREQNGLQDENFTHAFEDVTDRENRNFRYVY